jgi:hypothetical protein
MFYMMIADTCLVPAKLVEESACRAGSYIKLGYDIFFHNHVNFTHFVTHHQQWPLRPIFALVAANLCGKSPTFSHTLVASPHRPTHQLVVAL